VVTVEGFKDQHAPPIRHLEQQGPSF